MDYRKYLVINAGKIAKTTIILVASGVEPPHPSSSDEMRSGQRRPSAMGEPMVPHRVALKKNGGWGGELKYNEINDKAICHIPMAKF